MKRLSFGTLILFGIYLMPACNSNAKNNSSSNADTISSADSLNALKKTSPKGSAMAKSDAQFLAETTSAALTEIELGNLALVKGENKRVKNFGVMMEKDLVKADNKLIALGKSKKIALPAVPYAYDQKSIDSLSKKSGKDFDIAYVNFMIAAHNKFIRIFQNEVENSSDQEIKSFARKTLPALKNHLDAIVTIQSSME